MKLFSIGVAFLFVSLNTCKMVSQPATVKLDGPGIFHLSDTLTIGAGLLEIPAHSEKDMVIRHSGFTLFYDEVHEQAAWVAYELTLTETLQVVERSGKFRMDPKVVTQTANAKDYAYSGYDRGHLAPAADMSWSAESMSESFYYSNISPQDPGFNRGIWKRLEELVRSWAIQDSAVYVVTGPVLPDSLPHLGPNQVSVPNAFYKVILVNTTNVKKGIGFILKNEASQRPLVNFAVTIDSVELVTGIDFFPQLLDSLEINVEGSGCLSCWRWPEK